MRSDEKRNAGGELPGRETSHLTAEVTGPSGRSPVPCEKAKIPTYGLAFASNLVDSSFFTGNGPGPVYRSRTQFSGHLEHKSNEAFSQGCSGLWAWGRRTGLEACSPYWERFLEEPFPAER